MSHPQFRRGESVSGGTLTNKMSNALKQDITDRVVILRADRYKGSEAERKFLCEGGFGCHPHTNGTGVFGKFLSDGEQARVHGYDIEKLA